MGSFFTRESLLRHVQTSWRDIFPYLLSIFFLHHTLSYTANFLPWRLYIYTELADNVKQAFGILIQKKSLMVKINYRLIEDCTKVLTTVYMTLRGKLELVLLKDFAEENRSAPVG